MAKNGRMVKSAFIALLLTLSIALAPASAGTVRWGNATSSKAPEWILRDSITAEHLRVCGSPLSPDQRLVAMARYRSSDMLLNGYFAHRNPLTGLQVFDLMSNAGIKFANAGENIAWNSYSNDLTASAAYEQFMGSAGHRALIQDCQYTRFGVGDYRVGTRRMFAVLFVRLP